MKKVIIIILVIAAQLLVVFWPETFKLPFIIVSITVAVINLISGSEAKIWTWFRILSVSLFTISTSLYAIDSISKDLLIGLIYSGVALGLPSIATLLRKDWVNNKKRSPANSRRVSFLLYGHFLFSKYHCMYDSLILHTHFMHTILVHIALTRQNYTR